MDRRGEYEKRRSERATSAARLKVREGILSLVRPGLFVVAAILAWLSIGAELFSPAVIFVPLLLFIPIAIVHERFTTRRHRNQRAAKMYEAGLARMDGRFNGDEDDGARFRPDHHVYADDLDLFGKESLFSLVSRARTRAGGERIASWLLSASTLDEVSARQSAAAELQDRLDLREDFALAGDEIVSELHPEALRAWGSSARVVFSGGERLVAFLLATLSTFAVLFAIPAIRSWMTSPFSLSEDVERVVASASLFPLIAMLILGFFFRSRTRERVELVVASVERYARDLELLSLLFARLGAETFTSPRLTRSSRSASKAAASIERLQKLVSLLDSRRNQFFAPIAAILEWSFHIAVKVEQWRSNHGEEIGEWLDQIADFEALSSIASFSFEHPAYVLPSLRDDGPLEAVGLAHPLLPEEGTVVNDVTLGDETRLLVVSGSNMSGKSTFLRTIGTNLVLAYAGAPVRATSLAAPILKIGASIRINDSLQEGASRFFAEITRLREIVDLTGANATGTPEGDSMQGGFVRESSPVLFLIDEVLNGTNSHDRRIGAEAVLMSLIARDAIGVATTHDLALTEITQRAAGRARNVHFEDTIEDGTMTFDYRMRDGVVRKSNALALMRSIGLDVRPPERRPAETPAVLIGTMLRPWRLDDAESLALLANDIEIWRNLRDLFPHPYSIEHAREFLARNVGVTPPTNFAITRDGKLAGGVGLHPRSDVERMSAEIGYWVGEPFRKQGIATEAVQLISRYGLETLRFERIFAMVFEHNLSSMRVLEKAGFASEGIARRAAIKDGKVIDEHVYARTKG